MRVFEALQRAHSALFRAADKSLKKRAGISAAQTAILFILDAADGAPITSIATALNMGNSSITGLVDRMEKSGLVRRAASETDRRVQHVFLEPAGREICHHAAQIAARINQSLLAPFDETERKTIERFLRNISDNAADLIQSLETSPQTPKEIA